MASTSLPSAKQPRPLPPLSSGAVVVVIDGTWTQAKQILARYPFLSPKRTTPASSTTATAVAAAAAATYGGGPTELHGGRNGRKEREEGKDEKQEHGGEGGCFRPVKFRSAGVSSYGFRREPAKECLSTLESVAYTLEVNPECC